MNFNEEYRRWLESDALCADEKKELTSIMGNGDTVEFRFSSPMSFGTAGLRSTMYMGVACMNRFTVAQTTRGIAALVKKSRGENRGVVIAYDSRNNSELFAKVSACVLAGANIKVYIFNGIRPTPELSFAVRELGTVAGINITASHNPKEYNGYKAYWEDGAQITPEQAKIVSTEREKFDVLDVSGIADFDSAVADGLITLLDESFDEKYISAVLETAINPDIVREVANELKVVYTPLHGAGYKLVPEVFRRIGLEHLFTVDSQMVPDGNFPTVEKPNPEYAAVFKEGIVIADNVGSDLVIATDPDSDRVGVVTRNADGVFETVTGNQMGALLLDYVIRQKKERGILPSGAYCVKSLVSTDMAYAIAKKHGVVLHDVLTGFKFIGEVIKNYEMQGKKDGFLLGFEESYGYLFGSYARDKDAVGASMIILEMTAFYKKLGMTLSDALRELYKVYGYYLERTVDIYMEGLDGIEKRRRVMSSLRENPPKKIGGLKVVAIGDYSKGTVVNLENGMVESTGQPGSDVLYYTLETDDKVIIRPSGTEPKIKIYVLLHDADREALERKASLCEADARRLAEV